MNQGLDPRPRLVQHHLDEAQKALNADKLAEAQKHFEEALGIAGEHPDRAPDIRQALKKYCEQAVARPTPDWEAVHQMLDLFDILKLQNDETRIYQHELKLKEARFLLLKEDNLDGSFSIFANLMTNAERLGGADKIKNNIAQIVCEYASLRATQREWSLLKQVFERIQNLWPAADSIHDWLEAISQILNVGSQIESLHNKELANLEKTVTEQKKQIEQLHSELNSMIQMQDQLQIEVDNLTQARDTLQSDAGQAQRRAQTLTYALIGLLILAVLMYPLALLLP